MIAISATRCAAEWAINPWMQSSYTNTLPARLSPVDAEKKLLKKRLVDGTVNKGSRPYAGRLPAFRVD
ncbi:MAG TPA: hypothetical protein VNR87_09965 [Flavisolibacter sp.]|nr:hypothetical protein [Flavisolibacter sp.]